MDRQKYAPPISTKITRKLAQESADHNSLMNFYSSISRDESGAPKKWKMSSPLIINEELITNKKGSTSNKSTPTGSRENSSERKQVRGASGAKSQRGGRKKSLSRDGSSSEQNSSRESSLDSRDNIKDTPVVKKKRGRPKSLNLQDKSVPEKTMANGDSDNFKSPDPLTPCNITVKRKKGRPKETPPVLVAEAPVETLNIEKETDTTLIGEQDIPVKRKPGRPKKKGNLLQSDQLKSLSGGNSFKSVKRHEGKRLKTFGSKIIRNKVKRGFKKFRLPKQKLEYFDESFENVVDAPSEGIVGVNGDHSVQTVADGKSSGKRGPGRPPKVKKKTFFNTLTVMKSKHETDRNSEAAKNKPKFNPRLLNKPLHRRPGRPPGAKNKIKIVQNSLDTEKTKMNAGFMPVVEKDFTVIENVVNQIEPVNSIPVANNTENIKPKHVVDMSFNAIDEAIESIVSKARNDEPIEVKPRMKDHFMSSIFYKKRPVIASAAKAKKQKDLIEKIRKKRMLQAHETRTSVVFDTCHLASNDLRRKLHSKLIERMSLMKKVGESRVGTDSEPGHITVDENKTEEKLLKEYQTVSSIETQNLYVKDDKNATEERMSITDVASGADKSTKQTKFGTKISDTESVCSDLSSISFSSKRPVEKQILILGEDNMDSDDSTVRTRQRFEIIPGKKRKRTLSGEFDLLDEKRLRKLKKRDDKALSEEETSRVQKEELDLKDKKPKYRRKKSPVKKSPNLKVKDGKVTKKTGSHYLAYKTRLLKQSPFLSKTRKKKRKFWSRKKKVEDYSSTENAQSLDTKEAKKSEENFNVHNEKSNSVSSFESVSSRPESYRTGLFEKFSNDSCENPLRLESNIEETVDAKSDDTESTIELKDSLVEEPEDEPVEESVDDSDVYNFHAEDESESSAGNDLYTDSEIDIREMLFDLIDSIVNSCESQSIHVPRRKEECVTEGSSVPQEASPTECFGTTQDVHLESVKEIEKVYKADGNSDIAIESEGQQIESKLQDAVVSPYSTEIKSVEKVKKKVGRKPKVVPYKTTTPAANVDGTEKIRKKPGRKPKVNKINVEQNLTEKHTSPVLKLDTSCEMSTSPDSGIPRKFELRQKISRSPLDNIALKQSLEENKYLKVEAQRQIRKEAKLKSKLKVVQQESSEFLPVASRDEESKEVAEQEKHFSENEAEEELEETEDNMTPEDLIKECKPCRVILKDFIKELERTQGQTDSSDSDFDSQESQDSFVKSSDGNEISNSNETDKSLSVDEHHTLAESETKPETKICNNESEACEITEEETASDILKTEERPTVSEYIKETSINIDDASELKLATSEDDSAKLQDKNKGCNENKDTSLELKTSKLSDGKSELENNSKEIAPAAKSIDNMYDAQRSKDQMSSTKHESKTKEHKVRRKAIFKSKGSVPLKSKNVVDTGKNDQLKVNITKRGKMSKVISEQQTARKTVPPLKIKVKDSFSSRRKTYMVEPSPGSPVESPEKSNKPDVKHDKRKEKNKVKSGSRSESSDNEKLKVYHHKRKNKSPNTEAGAKSKGASNGSPQGLHKPVIKATDAYEANFLQFIQDKDKVEQNLAAFSSSLGQKHKIHSSKKKQVDGDFLSGSQDSNEDQTLRLEDSASTQDEKSNDSEGNDVQYVCSQCEDIVYRAKKDIVKHYAEVHPGHQFIYKPLPDSSPENSNLQTDVNSNEKKEEKTDGNVASMQQDKQSHEDDDMVNDEDVDSGSLNLKIVDVVSLKDQTSFLDNEMLDISKSENSDVGALNIGSDSSVTTVAVTTSDQNSTRQLLQQTAIGQVQVSTIPQFQSSHVPSQLTASPLQVNHLQQQFSFSQIQTNHGLTELKIPAYPLQQPFTVFASKPPPPYSAHTISIPTPVSSSIPGLVQANLRPRFSQINLVSSQPFVNNVTQQSTRPQVPVNQTVQTPTSQPGKLGHTFKCDKCNVHAPMLAAMVAHLRNCHKEIPRLFQCPYCKDMEAESEAHIHQHIKKNHPTNNPNPPVALSEPAKRNLKTLNIKLPENLKLGEGNNIEKDIYMCLKCKDHKPSLETIYEHLEQQHTDVFAYVCPLCKVFKSPLEEMVKGHILTSHGQNPGSVNISLAIDGNHFVRVQCLIKDKQKSSQKSLVSPTAKQHSSDIQQNGLSTAQSIPQVTDQPNTPQTAEQPTAEQLNALTSQPSIINALQTTVTLQPSKSPSPSIPSKSGTQQPQKKKKTLLESIEKLTVQKLGEQGLIGSKSESPLPITPANTTQLQISKPTVAGGAPPPLMRGPPPLIRYDQLNKVTSAQSAMFTSTVRTSSQLAVLNPATSLALQGIAALRPQNVATQSNAATRPIQSSLFDTSDLGLGKPQQSQRPVLNVPVVPGMANSHPSAAPSRGKEAVSASGAPLDLTKTTPSASPVPQNSASPGQQQISGGGGGGGINPEIFKVFNIRPGTQMQLQRPQGQIQQQIVAQPIMLPQQVRQNTPSTLAYRPPGTQMIAASQMPQFIGMPVGMVVTLGNASQGIPVPMGNPIPGLHNAQFVRMSTPQVSAAGTGTAMLIASSQANPVVTQAQVPKTSIAAQPFPKNMLFKCPYCPKVVPLRLDQVKPHIENQHPGSAVIFQQFETK